MAEPKKIEGMTLNELEKLRERVNNRINYLKPKETKVSGDPIVIIRDW